METPVSRPPECEVELTAYHRHCLELRICECDEAVASAVCSVCEAESWEPGNAGLHTLRELLVAARRLTELAYHGTANERVGALRALRRAHQQEDAAMAQRMDKHGHLLRIGDPVRLPSRREGSVRGFAGDRGHERVIVRYEGPGVDEVSLLPRLVERLGWKRTRVPAKRAASGAAIRLANRPPRGESHYRARLSEDQVRQMRRLHRRAGTGYRALALVFDCGVSTARDIRTNRTRRNA